MVEAEDPLSAVRKARGLADMGLPFVLVADRGMPTSDSASFDGGLEAVKRVQLAGLHPPILLMTDRMTRGFHARVRKLGVTNFVFKPGVSRLDPRQFEADLLAFPDPQARHTTRLGLRERTVTLAELGAPDDPHRVGAALTWGFARTLDLKWRSRVESPGSPSAGW